MASPMPVLPEVPSMIVPPGFSFPARSASSIIFTAMRSLIELPGLNVSILTRTVPLTTPFVIRLMRTIGVSPMASRMVLQIRFTNTVYTFGHRSRDSGLGIWDSRITLPRCWLSASHEGRAQRDSGSQRTTNHEPRPRIPNPESRIPSSSMPKLIAAPAVVAAAGTKPKRIEEFAGRVNSGHASVSVARMTSPSGWEEAGQRPEFEEITVVLRGMVRVEYEGGGLDVHGGQGVVTVPGEWVRYSTPDADGAEYIAVCLPAFSTETVHRD